MKQLSRKECPSFVGGGLHVRKPNADFTSGSIQSIALSGNVLAVVLSWNARLQNDVFIEDKTLKHQIDLSKLVLEGRGATLGQLNYVNPETGLDEIVLFPRGSHCLKKDGDCFKAPIDW